MEGNGSESNGTTPIASECERNNSESYSLFQASPYRLQRYEPHRPSRFEYFNEGSGRNSYQANNWNIRSPCYEIRMMPRNYSKAA